MGAPEDDRTGAAEGPGSDPRKRQQILTGAADVFMRSGFNGASMDKIAQAAGVSKGTLYVYFPGKEQLFEACIENKRRMHSQLLLDLDGSKTIEEELTIYGLSFARFITDPQLILAMRTVIGIAEQMPELGSQYYERGPNWGVSRLADFLAARVESGVLAIDDIRLAASQFIDLCQSNMVKPLLFGCSIPAHELETRIQSVVGSAVTLFLRAYGTRSAQSG